MRRACWTVCLLLLLPACGRGPQAAAPGWQHCRIEGLQNAGGLAASGDDLIAVAGGDDRAVYTFSRSRLVPGGSVRARTIPIEVKGESYLSGAEKFSEQGYQMEHLWKLPVDFQALATRAPNQVFVGDRNRRVVYWGRLVHDVGGQLTQVQLTRLFVAPGATRSDTSRGDWRDKGPGLCGLVATRDDERAQDLFVIDRGVLEGRFLRIRKTDVHGSVLGGTLVERDFEGEPEVAGLSWWQKQFVLLRGEGAGSLITARDHDDPTPRKPVSTVPGPEVPGVRAWTGVSHGVDGTVYLISAGSPAVVAWRAR